MILAYTINTLSRLYSLDMDKIIGLIEAEGITAYDAKNLSKVGYIPTLASYFKIDNEIEIKTYSNVKAEWFNIKNINGIRTVTINEPLIPVTSYLFSNLLDEEEIKHQSVLIPVLPGRKMFIGEDSLIRRLSQGVNEDYTIIPAKRGAESNA